MHLAWTLILLALTLFVFSVPLWPAFIELKRKDARRLQIDSQDDGSAKYAAEQAGQAKEINVLIAAGKIVNVVSAIQTVQVHSDCTFNWLDAPTIEFLSVDGESKEVKTRIVTPTLSIGRREKFKRIEGDWTTQKQSEIHGDYVVTQDVTLTENTLLYGSIKSYGSVKLSKGAVVHGSIFAKKKIELSSESFAAGVVSAGEQICLHAGCVVGYVEQLGSVSAPYIVAHAGSMVHGSLQASVQGLSKA
jgi:hypothetical protein